MAKMKAVQISAANGPFQLVEREVPSAGSQQVRIRVEACGICHSDAFVKFGAYPGLQLPRIPGHEIAGKIDAVGEGVTAWKVGDRVGVGWHGGHCFQCTACRKGLFINCEKAKVCGVSYDGGYAEFVVVPQEAVARMPADWTPWTRLRYCVPASRPSTHSATAARAPAIRWPSKASAGSGILAFNTRQKWAFARSLSRAARTKRRSLVSSARTSTSIPTRPAPPRVCRSWAVLIWCSQRLQTPTPWPAHS